MKLPPTRAWFRLAASVSFAVLLSGGARLRAADCNSNGTDDLLDISSGTSRDCNSNAVPDECELSEDSIAYEAREPLPTGFSSSVLAQDFDGDGDPDLMVAEFRGANWQEGQPEVPAIAYLRNLGQGRFDDPVRYEVAGKPYTLFARDLDGDADPDVLVIFGESSSVGVLRNRGDGSFDAPTYFSVGSSPFSRVRDITADLDGDQDLDVVTSNNGSDDLSILLNRGDGSFEPQSRVEVARPYYFVFADVDADGDVDIVLDTYNTQEYTQPGSLVVLKNDGHGAFPDRQSYQLGQWMQELAASDLDGDQDVDIVVAQERPRLLAVLMNRGDGQFDLAAPLDPHHVPGQNQPEHVLIADIDGDGKADILTGADGLYGTRENITLFLNQGGGSFAAGVPLLAGDEPEQIEVRDLNGDGRPEILALNYFSGDLTVLRNLGGGAFAEGIQFPISRGGAASMSLADLDADGDLDVASVGFDDKASLVILDNISGGSFTRGCNAFRRGDANSDGEVSIADIITIRRYLFEGSVVPTCFDAADATDNDEVSICDAVKILETLYRNPAWQDTLPAPSPDAGQDPTPLAEPKHPCDLSSNVKATRPLGCAAYQVEPPQPTNDILRVGDAVGIPGELAKVPVHLTASVPVDAIQVVLSYDPAVLEPALDVGGISFESTYLERFEQPFGILSAQPEHRVLVAAIAGNLILPGSTVEPGDDILVGWINVRVKPDATPGEIDLEPTNGPDDAGVGPYRLRNEITHQGAARFVSFIPKTVGGRLGIVGDQSLFIRGDANGDRKLDVSDPIASLAALFLGAPQPDCADAADSNDDGAFDLTDAIFTLSYLFQGTRRPPAPFPALGTDPTADSLECFPPPQGR